jgi:hypothetical protein
MTNTNKDFTKFDFYYKEVLPLTFQEIKDINNIAPYNRSDMVNLYNSSEFAVKYRNEACEGLSMTNIVLEPEVVIAGVTPKKGRKPKVAVAVAATGETTTVVAEDIPTIPRKPRKKPAVSPYSTLVNTTSQLVHKEVSLPTHIETKLEEIDSSGYKIQYVKLGVFDANGTSYFRDAVKNKLYKKVKDKIGGYVGRWNPDTDSIIVDIPDSDDESI